MGAGAVNRAKQRKTSREKKGNWASKYQNLRDSFDARVHEIEQKANHQVEEALIREVGTIADLEDSRDHVARLRVLGPGVFEIENVKRRWFGARLRWALGFALTGRLRCESE